MLKKTSNGGQLERDMLAERRQPSRLRFLLACVLRLDSCYRISCAIPLESGVTEYRRISPAHTVV